MIIVELVDNETRERRYSDQNVMIRQIETGALYEDAVDVIPCKYTYEETDIPIPEEPDIPDEDGPRYLTPEEAEIVDHQLNSEATETGVTL